jgi:hypothetical protein
MDRESMERGEEGRRGASNYIQAEKGTRHQLVVSAFVNAWFFRHRGRFLSRIT